MTPVAGIPARGGNGLCNHPAPTAILRPMQAQAVTFDTHAFVKRLTKAGMPEDQAEVLANGQSDLYERLVTKEYFEFTSTTNLRNSGPS